MVYTIGLEEHVWTQELLEALEAQPASRRDDSLAMHLTTIASGLLDFGEQRLQRMDEAGIDMQVLSMSTPATQSLLPADAVALARDANDQLADAVRMHPDRFAAFATLPTPDPNAAAAELRRSVDDLGFVGAMLFPRTGDLYLDHESFRPIFEVAAELRVPLYLHPQTAPHAVRDATYSGFTPEVSLALAMGGWGWHVDAGLSALRLILAGTFDRHPDLQLVLGHWGELLVFFHERVDVMSDAATYLQGRVGEYITANLHVTPSGIFSNRMLTHALSIMGSDRILLSSDFPFVPIPEGGARTFIDRAPISPEDKEKIGHRNAEVLLGIAVPHENR